jgi:3-phosphoshikimate 1-carboxyvinyltransferase
MMKAVNSSKVDGSINAPASKSVMIRTVAASLLAQGISRILNPSFCEDSLAALNIADTLGADIEIGKRDVTMKGNGGLKEGGPKGNTIKCGESGLCMRMFTPIAGLTGRRFIVEGSGSLLSRPMTMVETLSRLGGSCATHKGYPPITIEGPIRGGSITLDGSESSQFLTGLLMSLPLCKEDSVIEVLNLKSKPYVEITIDLLKAYGVTILYDENFRVFEVKGNQEYKAQTYTVEGDWSGAAFLLVAGAIAGSAKVKGLRIDSFQADKAVLEALRKAGAKVEVTDDYIAVARNHLRAFEFDATDCPDLVPPLVALASHCEGKSVIYGIERLKHKESNRAVTLASEFSKLAIRVDILSDRVEVYGGKPTGNLVDSHNDHRIAMACAIAALDSQGPVMIENPKCVAKSYPDFFEDLNSIKVAL